MQDIVLYDWLSFTTKRSDPYYIVDLLGMKEIPWQLTKGARGYQDRLYFNAISIHFNGRDDMGVWCEMSGQGCRAFETLSGGKFLHGLFAYKCYLHFERTISKAQQSL